MIYSEGKRDSTPLAESNSPQELGLMERTIAKIAFLNSDGSIGKAFRSSTACFLSVSRSCVLICVHATRQAL